MVTLRERIPNEATLRFELLDAMAASADRTGLRAGPAVEHLIDDIMVFLRPHFPDIESWAYGEERECQWQGHDLVETPPGSCPHCNGTGKTREPPGLVERATTQAVYIAEARGAPVLAEAADIIAALRQELG